MTQAADLPSTEINAEISARMNALADALGL